MTHEHLYYVTMACGFLVVEYDVYDCTFNPREATAFISFAEADRAAKDALLDFLASGDLHPTHQYFAIFQPSFA